ncbi:hypothetical protein C8R42DRAFT_720748 [Lentinula raphanica]|nr:hypothetical protein C8R42DRAFT_720748 [Lentinula raphanica]
MRSRIHQQMPSPSIGKALLAVVLAAPYSRVPVPGLSGSGVCRVPGRRGHTAVEEMEYVVKDFVKKAGKEGGRAMLSELEKGAESAKTHDTQSATRIVGRELNRRVRKMNEQRMKEFEEASRRVQEGLTTELTPLALIPEFDESSRAGRGLQNDMTGSLLCPGEIDWNDTNQIYRLKKV